MSNDIGADLLRKIRAEFGESLNDKSTTAAKLLEKIEDGKGTFNDVFALSTQCGEILSKLFAKYVAPENLPDGRLYYNIAQTILESTLRENYNLINLAAQAAQEHADKELGLNIAPKKAPFPQERVDKIIGAAADDTADWNTISRRLDAPIRNVTVSFYNDYIKENAEFRSRAGLKAVVIRQTNGKCCDWCAAIAGRYEYPGVPDTVWGFHDNCTCSVLYSSSKTTSVHNRRNRQGYRLEGEERKKALANARKPVRYTPEQAERIQNNVLNRLAFSGNGGIIRSIDVDDYELITYGKGIAPEVNDVILTTMKKCEKEGSFIISEISTDVKTTSTHGTPVLQIEPMSNGLLKLNINADFLSGKTLAEINEIFSKSENTIVSSLSEAIIHESGHAKSIKGLTNSEIANLYDELGKMHLQGVSKLALSDGAECLAELEVLRSRKTEVSKELAEFYKKYMGVDY